MCKTGYSLATCSISIRSSGMCSKCAALSSHGQHASSPHPHGCVPQLVLIPSPCQPCTTHTFFFSPLPPVPPAGQFLYDTTGTFTFTPPSGVTQVSVLCTAGGGGAGSFVGGTGSAAGGGGGGTCYANK